MANFCSSCGTAVTPGAGFCQGCGARLTPQAAAPPPPAPEPPIQPVSSGPVPPAYSAAPQYQPTPSKGSPVLKFVLIGLALLFMLGLAGAVGAYYFVRAKVHDKMAELKERTGVDIPSAIESAGRTRPVAGLRNGCLLLSKEEAQTVLGIDLVRTEGASSGSTDEHCAYYTSPDAAKAAADKAAEQMREIQKSSGTNSAEDVNRIGDIVKGIGASNNDGSAPILELTVFRGDAKVATTAVNLGGALMQGGKTDRVSGPWDEGIFGPLSSTLTVRKGDNGFMLDLRQIPGGRAKGLELAKIVADRL